MKKTIDLLTFELYRIRKAYFVLLAIIATMQIGAVVQTANQYLMRLEIFQRETNGNAINYLSQWGPISYSNVQGSLLTTFSVILGIIAIGFYVFAIWYRDWIGKNNFSYRLLALPGSRMSIYWSKLLTILFLIAGLLSLQVLLNFIGNELLQLLVPNELFQSLSPTESVYDSSILLIVLPPALGDFFINYLVGITALIAVNMLILIELSYKWIGITIDVLLFLVGNSILVILFRSNFFAYLFPKELLLLIVFSSLFITILAIGMSKWLIERKISV